MNKHLLKYNNHYCNKTRWLGLEKSNNNVKTRQPKERLPLLLISQVMQCDFVNYHKWVDFPNSWKKIKSNSISGLTELTTKILITNVVTI